MKKRIYSLSFFLVIAFFGHGHALWDSNFFASKNHYTSTLGGNSVQTKSNFGVFGQIEGVEGAAAAAPAFSAAFLKKHENLPQEAESLRARAQGVIDEVVSKSAFVGILSGANLLVLPVGLSKKIGDAEVIVAVNKCVVEESYSSLTVFCSLKLPQIDPSTGQNKILLFGVEGIKVSHGGQVLGDARIALLGDYSLALNGGNLLLTLKGSTSIEGKLQKDKSYVTLACDGIKEIGIAADVLFPRSMLVPLNGDYSVNTNSSARVQGSFMAVVTDWRDIIAEISFEPFALKGLEKFAISIDKAVFDMSDVRNAASVLFPAGYENLIPGNESLWKGVYVNSLKIILPPEFKNRGSTKRVSFEASQMLIDNLGLTGKFIGRNVLETGTASGWEFSVDNFLIDISTNTLKGASFDGYLALPITQRQLKDSLSKTAFKYSAIIGENSQYLLRVQPKNDLRIDMWQATAQFDNNSYVELSVKNDQFLPKAVLSGRLSMALKRENARATSSKDTTPIASFTGIIFQQLTLQTEAPYISAGYFGYNGEVKLGNFPVSLSEIALGSQEKEVRLTMAVKVNLMQGKISGATNLTIVGELEEKEALSTYVFRQVEINKVAIEADFKGFKMKGAVAFTRKDPIMGTGFSGKIAMTIGIGKPVNIEALAAFGSKAEGDNTAAVFRYWYVDALVGKITIPVGAFKITAIGLGASYHMQKLSTYVVEAAVCPTKLGYIPNAKMGLGLRGMLIFSVGNKSITRGEAGLEMVFNNSGGLNNIGLYGKAYFLPGEKIKNAFDDIAGVEERIVKNLTEITEKVSGKDSAFFANNATLGKFTEMAKTQYPQKTPINNGDDGMIYAFAGISYDLENKVLHANIDLYINVAKGLIRGRGNNNRAGWAVMHFGPENWYIYLGTPSDRMGLKIGVGSLSAEIGAYFVTGSTIPKSPPPPPIVANILGVQVAELDYMRDLNSLNDGAGFAFGADFSINTGDLRFLIFYASFQAGLGFDIMLKDYGEAHCKGESGPIGMNGWYANGQAYAYLQGELGIQVKLAFIKRRIPIIKAGAAVLLQAKLPNPAWFRGYVGGYFSVLGGLIRGRFRFKVTIGRECELVDGSALAGIKIISEVNPSDKATGIDVFAAPQAVFNMPINKPFPVEEAAGTKTYRVKLESFTVIHSGTALSGKIIWNDRKDMVVFESFEILPPKTNLKVQVKVSFEQQQGGNWQSVIEQGQKIIEEKSIEFTTGSAPETIPLTNILFAYPVVDQVYFHPQEYNKGYIQLKRGQAYLMHMASYRYISHFTENSQAVAQSFTYDSVARSIHFDLPHLKLSTQYHFSLDAEPPGDKGLEAQSKETMQQIGDAENDIQVADNKSGGMTYSSKARSLLNYSFKSSRYQTFAEKIHADKLVRPLYEIVYSDVGALEAVISGQEGMSTLELLGSEYTHQQPLVQPLADLNNPWYQQKIAPLLYTDYPLEEGITINRAADLVGFPPVRSVEPLAWYVEMSTNNVNNALLVKRLPHRYFFAYYAKTDFIDIQSKAVNRYLQERIKNPPSFHSRLAKYLTTVFPAMLAGKYTVRYQYVLPGNIIASTTDFEFENPLQ